jgi:predicted nuclease of predicted toxin-antitoxin system
MIMKRPFLKQKLHLYFDENFPEEVASYFVNCLQLKKKLTATSARICGNRGRTDEFHYNFCQSKGYTLVTRDTDFNNDHDYPFTSDGGKPIPGIIIIRATQVLPVARILSRLVFFLMQMPLPRDLLLETKFVAGQDTVLMRRKDVVSKEIKSLQIQARTAISTTISEIHKFFNIKPAA